MPFKVLDSVNDPGDQSKRGDDCHGQSGDELCAWVIDGATDLTDLKPFPDSESGASWYAHSLSHWLSENHYERNGAKRYFRDAITGVMAIAESESVIRLKDLPPHALPSAAGMWVHLDEERSLHFAWLGDCFALLKRGNSIQTFGDFDGVRSESTEAIALNGLSPRARLCALQQERATQHQAGKWVFGFKPEAIEHLNMKTLQALPGDLLLLMTDGLFRMVHPYGLMSVTQFFRKIEAEGLESAIAYLRRYEFSNAARNDSVKKQDDAAGLLLKVL